MGLFYVKWFPYYNRAFVAASQHSIGKSILMGTAASPPAPSWQAALDYALAYGKAIWQAMVLGLLLGSAVQALIPPQWVARALGKSDFGSVVNGGLMSLPGMMCTCCAAPVVAGLRARQAAPGAAIAFWLGNTVLNPATLVFMGFVLGWQWVGLRLALGMLMVFGLGYLVNRLVTPKEAEAVARGAEQLVAQKPGQPVRALAGDSRAHGRAARARIHGAHPAARRGTRVAVSAYRSGHRQQSAWIVAFAVAGMLFVIPTAGEVPIIQAMLALGMGVGPAGALLLTLPPISVPSLAMLARSFRPRVLAVVAASVVGFGIVAGLLAIRF